MRRITLILIVLTGALLAGCATQKRSSTLTTTLEAYGSTLRWGDFQTASKFIDPKVLKKDPLSELDMARYKQVRISDYDSGSGPVPIDDTHVQQVVHIGLINIHTQVERSLIDRQTWRYDEKDQHWWLTSGLPDITVH